MSTTALVRTDELADEIFVPHGVTVDLLDYLSTDEYEVTITSRYGLRSYTLSYHGSSLAENHSNNGAIWGLTLVVDKHMHGGFFKKSVRENCLSARKVTRRVTVGKQIEVDGLAVHVDALCIKRVLRG